MEELAPVYDLRALKPDSRDDDDGITVYRQVNSQLYSLQISLLICRRLPCEFQSQPEWTRGLSHCCGHLSHFMCFPRDPIDFDFDLVRDCV